MEIAFSGSEQKAKKKNAKRLGIRIVMPYRSIVVMAMQVEAEAGHFFSTRMKDKTDQKIASCVHNKGITTDFRVLQLKRLRLQSLFVNGFDIKEHGTNLTAHRNRNGNFSPNTAHKRTILTFLVFLLKTRNWKAKTRRSRP